MMFWTVRILHIFIMEKLIPRGAIKMEKKMVNGSHILIMGKFVLKGTIKMEKRMVNGFHIVFIKKNIG